MLFKTRISNRFDYILKPHFIFKNFTYRKNNTEKSNFSLLSLKKVLFIFVLVLMMGGVLFFLQKTGKEKIILPKNVTINRDTGIVSGISAYEAPFPNVEPRSNPKDISLLVIHDTEIVDPDNSDFRKSIVHYLFTQQHGLLKKQYPMECAALFPEGRIPYVAAHLVIRRNGEVIQYSSFNRLAHHAGVSVFEKRENCNEFSIGIELEGFADKPDYPYTEIQYQQLAKLTNAILDNYPKITLDRITGHEDIALPAGRKTDPGSTFDWIKYRNLIADKHHQKIVLNKISKEIRFIFWKNQNQWDPSELFF